jgi:hypothetical protein
MLVVNFFAGAGAGKSTIASEVFWKLKKLGYSTELVGEYAKEAIIANNLEELKDQVYLFAQQLHRLRCMEQSDVEVAICDSPLPLGLIYQTNETEVFEQFVWSEFNRFHNMNYFLERIDGFWKPDNRMGTEKIAKQNDKLIKELIIEIPFKKISPFNGDIVVRDVEKEVHNVEI